MNEISAEKLQDVQVSEPRLTSAAAPPVTEMIIGGMRCSPNGTSNLDKALASAQAEFPVLDRNRTVEVKRRDGSAGYEFKYATFDHIVHLHRPILAKHGLALTQAIAQHPRGNLMLMTRLAHGESGEWTMESLPLPDIGDRPQDFGSAVTYSKRYSYCSKLQIAAEEDDDGNAAQGNSVRTIEDRAQRQAPSQQPALRPQAAPQRPPLGDSMPGGARLAPKPVENGRDHPPVDMVLRLMPRVGSKVEEDIQAVDNKSLDEVWKQRFKACLGVCRTPKAVADWVNENLPLINEAEKFIPAAVSEMQTFHNEYLASLAKG